MLEIFGVVTLSKVNKDSKDKVNKDKVNKDSKDKVSTVKVSKDKVSTVIIRPVLLMCQSLLVWRC
jgi:hypothetical protein